MSDHIKVIAPAIALIIVVAAGGAYALNFKQQTPTPTAEIASSQETAKASESASVVTFDQLVDQIANDANEESTEFETSVDDTATGETAADDPIINAATNQTYDEKF